MDSVHIIQVSQVTDELIESIARLLPQLSQKPIPSREDLTEIVASPNTIIITACDENCIIAMLTLVLYRTPSGSRARIEDVVVDQASRGKGIAKAMIRYAIDLATQKNALTIDLTSEPNRKAAIQLYQKIGFKRHETNTYRFTLG